MARNHAFQVGYFSLYSLSRLGYDNQIKIKLLSTDVLSTQFLILVIVSIRGHEAVFKLYLQLCLQKISYSCCCLSCEYLEHRSISSSCHIVIPNKSILLGDLEQVSFVKELVRYLKRMDVIPIANLPDGYLRCSNMK